MNGSVNGFIPGGRARCIDATPLPINVPGAVSTEFSFPCGFIEEGAVYVVKSVSGPVKGSANLILEEVLVLHHGREIPWCGVRFRPLEEEEAVWHEAREGERRFAEVPS